MDSITIRSRSMISLGAVFLCLRNSPWKKFLFATDTFYIRYKFPALNGLAIGMQQRSCNIKNKISKKDSFPLVWERDSCNHICSNSDVPFRLLIIFYNGISSSIFALFTFRNPFTIIRRVSNIVIYAFDGEIIFISM